MPRSVDEKTKTMGQYDAVTMVVLTIGHRIRCILWEQVAMFNKRIGFLCGLEIFELKIFCEEYSQSSPYLML